jgi:hypothetical protein
VAAWELAPCLVYLFREFNIIAPLRDHTSDGSIGDTAHQQTNSDHNPDKNGIVHAIDVDNNFNAKFTMEDCIQFFVSECRKTIGTDRGRLKYFIYNRRIWEAPNWVQRVYTGPSPHTEHAHFSCEYDPRYANDTRPWGLVAKFGKDDELPMDQVEFNQLFKGALSDPAVAASFATMFLDKVSVADYADLDKPQRTLTNRQWIGYSEGRGQVTEVQKTVEEVLTDVSTLSTQVYALQRLIETHVSGIIEGSK